MIPSSFQANEIKKAPALLQGRELKLRGTTLIRLPDDRPSLSLNAGSRQRLVFRLTLAAPRRVQQFPYRFTATIGSLLRKKYLLLLFNAFNYSLIQINDSNRINRPSQALLVQSLSFWFYLSLTKLLFRAQKLLIRHFSLTGLILLVWI